MAYEVFLSYTRIKQGPENLITQFRGKLEQKLKEDTRLTTEIFFDSKNIATGVEWSEEIEKALNEARIFVSDFPQLGFKVHRV